MVLKDDHCPDCWSDNVIFNSYEQLVCRACGLISQELGPDEQRLFEIADREPN